MPTYTPAVAGSAILNGSHTWNFSDADWQNVINYLVEHFTPPGQSPITPAQALLAWQQGVVDKLREETRNYLKRQVVVTAPVFT